MTDWLILTATLPVHPSALRVRVWRALKATGAGTLREGVYVLPARASTAPALRDLASQIVAAGASAHLLAVTPDDEAQAQGLRELFDRSAVYAELMQDIRAAGESIGGAPPASLRATLRTLEQRLQQVQGTDFFPDRSARQASDAMARLRRQAQLRLHPGEPAMARRSVAARAPADYQGRTWATRRRPWVDRLGTAWLVQRFIDRAPRFLWLDNPKRCPKAAIGYDFDGAAFTHVGDQVTFEVVARSFGLLDDPALRRVASVVHCLDVGGQAVDEAAGIEQVVRGLHLLHLDDDALLNAALPLFDALYAAWQHP